MFFFTPRISLLIFFGCFCYATAPAQESSDECRKAFIFNHNEYSDADTVMICRDTNNTPSGYLVKIDMPVCSDTLCAKVILQIYWDLAGNFVKFDTLKGEPLTKFDHEKFDDADYKKLDQILKNKNSVLQSLEKEDLVDKSIIKKATTVDAVTGATPSTIKNAVVDGAVYTSYALWHFVNGSVRDSIQNYTEGIYSKSVARQLLSSSNYKTQLFALKRIDNKDYESNLPLLFQLMEKSVPLIKAYIVSKAPLPFRNQADNEKLILLFPTFDGYSKSIFLDRITNDKEIATIFIPLMKSKYSVLAKRELEKIRIAAQKIGISDYP